MQASKLNLALLPFCGSLLYSVALSSFAMPVHPEQTPETPEPAFVLDQSDYERQQHITENFTETQQFSVTEGGRFALTLSDLDGAGSLRKLGAFIADPSDSQRFVHQVGDGRLVFDLLPGLYSLNLYAKPVADSSAGGFSLRLEALQPNPATVPVPGALWLLGSGLVAFAGMTRRKLI